MLLAETIEDYRANSRSPKSNPFVHTLRGWKLARRARTGILEKCSETALDEFETSLEFFEDRLSAAKFRLLEEEIGKDGVVVILGLFGIGPRLAQRSYNKGCHHVTGKCVYYKSGYCSGEPCGIIA
jgi:hypothetical protein